MPALRKDIVVLCPESAVDELGARAVLAVLETYSGLYFVHGECGHPQALMRAGVNTASRLVIMDDRRSIKVRAVSEYRKVQ